VAVISKPIYPALGWLLEMLSLLPKLLVLLCYARVTGELSRMEV